MTDLGLTEDRRMNPISEMNMAIDSSWRPAYLPPSAWHEHGMFARWIVAELRPKSVVELGTHNGYSYFVFCSALKEFGIAAEAHAVDSWKGDEHAGFYGEQVYSEVEQINTAEFSAFSTLHRAYFDEALDDFATGSVDLLHIDGRHGYDDVKHDFESWLPTLSERGIVLFHDIAEVQPGFGVGRFWTELTRRYPSFEFEHGHGLGVLAVGTELPESIGRLVHLSAEDAAVVRVAYAAWGSALTAEYERSELQRQLATAEDALAEQRDRLEDLDEEVQNLRRELVSVKNYSHELQQTLSWRITKPLRAIRRLQRR